jgi:K(+)-stimulated pyrophosphate-energized sodium pump
MESIAVNTQDDQESRFALGLIFALIVVVVASVLTYAVMRDGTKSAKSVATAASNAAPATPIMAAASTPATAGAASSDAPAPAQPASAEGSSVKVENGVVKFYFAPGKAELAPDSAKILTEILAAAKTGKKLAVSGYVDPSGDPQKNSELAKLRAFAVRDLLAALGVPAEQIVMVRPNDIKAGATTAAEGRRVEVSLI